VPPVDDDRRSARPEESPLSKRMKELSAEFERQRAQAAEAIGRVHRNLEITQQGRGRWQRARAGSGALAELLAARTAAERASEAKSRALAALSHDLRQPLQIIAITADRLRAALAAGPLPADRVVPQLDRIDRSVDQMTAAFDSLLQLARAEFGPAPALAAMPLQPLFDAIAEAHRPAAEAKGLTLRCVPVRVIIRSDPDALSSILHNFVGNAVKFTEAGGRVLLGCRRRGAAAIEIQVCDTGRGIPPDALDSVFQPFARLDASEPGFGLGLSIVKRHAEALGHELTCRSAPGKGSCFGVRVPRAPVEGEAG
jgi:signal transduction histidine kinase